MDGLSKMIYVMDEPKHCDLCEILYCDHETPSKKERPADCPLKPMPEYTKPDSKHRFDGDVAYAAGWNSCLEEIGGGDEDCG